MQPSHHDNDGPAPPLTLLHQSFYTIGNWLMGLGGILFMGTPVVIALTDKHCYLSESRLWSFLSITLGLGLMLAALLAFGRADRDLQRLLVKRACSEPMPPVLILRPFHLDELLYTPQRVVGLGREYAMSSSSYLPQLAEALALHGLPIALGRAPIRRNDFGNCQLILWLEETNENWWTLLRMAAAAASIIVVIPAHTEGLARELKYLADQAIFTKVIVVMPPTPRVEIAWSPIGRYPHPTSISYAWSVVRNKLISKGIQLPPHDTGGMLYIPNDDFSISRSVSLNGEWSLEKLRSAINIILPHLSGTTTSTAELFYALQGVSVSAGVEARHP